MPKKVKGLHTYRFRDNPEEKRFAAAWTKNNVLPWLLGPGDRKVDPSKRDEEVAATVVQWLGSPVGQAFLNDLGYVKRDDDDED